MNEVIDKIMKRRRCLLHKRYVRSLMASLHMEIAKHAIDTGQVDMDKRKLLLKYKNYYEKL